MFKSRFVTDKNGQDDQLLCTRSSCHRQVRLDDAQMHNSPESKRSNNSRRNSAGMTSVISIESIEELLSGELFKGKSMLEKYELKQTR
jgi:hypothetical protein